MTDFDEVLKLERTDSTPGSSLLESIIRPTRSGQQVLAVPSNTVGLAYRVSGTTLELVTVFDGEGVQIEHSEDIGVQVVNLAASFDGRLVAVACADGSLQCYNSTSSGFAFRWALPNAHSHVTSSPSVSPSASRDHAAGAAGPVRSLEFSPHGYTLLLVNDSNTSGVKRFQLFNAAGSNPADLIQQQLDNVSASSAGWKKSNSQSNSFVLAVGDTAGTVHIYEYTPSNATLEPLSQYPFQGDQEDSPWSCTHVDWSEENLGIGYCRVISISDEEDEGDEDCAADHEAVFYIVTMDNATHNPLSEWVELGDVVPFFSVPKHGRHVYFTSFCPTKHVGVSFLVVASNVGSDIAVLAKTNDREWAICEIPDGSNPTTPTDDDDEFTFPMGIATVTAAGSGRQCLLLAATDGSLTNFQFTHEHDSDYFMLPSSSTASILSDSVVSEGAAAEFSSPSEVETSLADEPPSSAAAPAASTGFSFSGTSAPVFGSSTSAPLSIFESNAPAAGGVPAPFFASSPAPFGGGTGKPTFGSPAFGTASALGGTSPVAPIAISTAGSETGTGAFTTKTDATSFGGFGSTFGSNNNKSIGFGELAKSPPLSGFGVAASFAPASSVFSGFASQSATAKESLFSGAPRATSFSRNDPESDSPSEDTNSDTDADSDEGNVPAATTVTGASSAFDFGSGSAFGTGSQSPAFESSLSMSNESTKANTLADAATSSPFGSFGTSGGSTFGSGSAPTFKTASPFTPTISKDTSAAESPAQFNLFAKPDGATPHAFMTKPLFGATPSPALSAAATAVRERETAPVAPVSALSPASKAVDDGKVAQVVSGDANLEEPSAKKASSVFDSFDKEKKGLLPSSMFEDLQDELGEGFYGDEMDKQIQVIDPDDTGNMKRSAFIKWYVDLVADQDKDAEESLSEGELAERAEEKEKAAESFMKFAKTADGNTVINVTDLGKVIECLGSTYCEEEHRNTLKKLKKADETIEKSEFLEWYIKWLFGGDDDWDNDEDANKTISVANQSTEATGVALRGDPFKVAEDTWQCKTCMVRNKKSTTVCIACSTQQPGHTGESAPTGSTSVVAGSAIGSGGFTFGTPATESTFGEKTTTVSTEGYTFGTPAATSTSGDKTATIRTEGFTFGGVAVLSSSGFSFAGTPAANTDASQPAKQTSGLTFGDTAVESSPSKPSTRTKPAAVSGLTFSGTAVTPLSAPSTNSKSENIDAPMAKKAGKIFDSFDKERKGVLPISKFEDMQDEVGEGFCGNEMDQQIQIIDPDGTGKISKSSFIKWFVDLVTDQHEGNSDSVSDGELAEREEEKSKATKAFLSLSTKENGVDVIDVAQFEKLIEDLGSTYCEEEHMKTLKKLKNTSGKIQLDDFCTWYVQWLFAGDEDSDDELDFASNKGTAFFKEKATSASAGSTAIGWGGAFNVAKDSWQCNVCMVRNDNKDTICPACETPRPGHEGTQAESKSEKSSSSIGTGGFTFGVPTAAVTGGFSFGVPAGDPPSATSAPATSEFSFGSPSTGFTFGGTTIPLKTLAEDKNDAISSNSAKPKQSSGGSSTPPPSLVDKTLSLDGNAPVPALKAATSDAFPPMASKAPTPFDGKAPVPATKASRSEAFPPIASKAPTPFSEEAPIPTPKASGGAAFPPMASKAPKPFGGNTSVPSPKASSSAAFPPMSSKAPTHFGGKTQAPAPQAAGSAAFPSMASKAPTPFGGNGDGTAPVSPKLATGSSPFAFMPTKAPVTFGSASSTLPEPANTTSAFPPSASKASASLELSTLSAAKTNETSKPKSRKMTECEGQYVQLVGAMEQTLEQLEYGRPATKDTLQDFIEQLVVYIGTLQTICSECDNVLSSNAKLSAFLLSRKTDISRQVAEARRFLETSQGGASDILTSQPLDRDSEEKKRQLSTQNMQVKNLINILEQRLNLITGICSSDAEEGKSYLLENIMASYVKVKAFMEDSERIRRKVTAVSQRVPQRQEIPSSALKTYKSPATSRKPTRIAPLPLSAIPESSSTRTNTTIRDKKKASAEKWGLLEASLKRMNGNRPETTKLGVKSLPLAIAPAPISGQKVGRSPAPSMLLPASSSGFPSSPALGSKANSTVALFSPPSAMKGRPDWNRVSELDRAKQVSLTLPKDVQETTFSSAARDVLTSFGTTPEKVKASNAVSRRGVSSKPTRQQLSSPIYAPSGERKKTPQSEFPPMPNKTPSNPFAKTSSKSEIAEERKKPDATSFPPMSKIAPSPLPVKGDQSSKASMRTMPVKDALPTTPTSSAGKDKTDPNASSASTYGGLNMGGLGTSLFGVDKNSDTQSPIGTAATVTSSGAPDYLGIATSFYQKWDPSKVQKVPELLNRYAGREEEMFRKMAGKYNTENPLTAVGAKTASVPNTVPSPASNASPFGASASTGTAPAPSPFSGGFGSTPSVAPATPFSSSGPAPAASPFSGGFGSTAAKSPATFGSSVPAPVANPFSGGGMSTPAPGPFGSSTPFTSGGASSPMTPAMPAFGSSSQQPAASGQQTLFKGMTAKAMLTSFYQQRLPEKLGHVETNLKKYAGREVESKLHVHFYCSACEPPYCILTHLLLELPLSCFFFQCFSFLLESIV